LNVTLPLFDAGGSGAVRQRANVRFDDIASLERATGGEPIESSSFEVTQVMIDEFARATSDSQWIHVDPERARRESPFGKTVAHGFLSLSLLSPLLNDCVAFPFARLVLNFGFERIRFIAPVPAGSSVIGRFRLLDVTRTEAGARLLWGAEISIAGASKPAVAANWLLLALA
jgi:acyl dehydratase